MAGTITGGMGSTDPGRQPFKYNGKELDSDHGFNTYDYSARYYDPAITRFTSVDPLAEKYYSWSPYVYCMNNPMFYTDPTGMSSDPPEWMKAALNWGNEYRKGAWGAAAGMAQSLSVLPVIDGIEQVWKVVDAYESGGFGASAEQYVNSVYETSGAQGIVQTAEGVANGDPQAIGAAATMAATFYVAKKAGNSTGTKANGEVGKPATAAESITKKPYAPKDPNTGEFLKVEKTKAGNVKIDAEARGAAHTQLRMDETGNYVQRNTFDAKGRRRADTHFTTHGEAGKASPHKHMYYKDGRRQKGKGN